ncbi:MAG: DUF6282 family protein [Syntrophales bacterium]
MERLWDDRIVSDKAKKLLIGGYDIHVHGNPSYGPNCEGFERDDFEIIRDGREAGLKGICIKNYEFTTVFRDYLVNKIEKQNGYGSCRYFSSMTLNLPVGGINPFAADFAVQHGVKCIWFPTYSAQTWELQFGWSVFDGYSKDIKYRESLSLRHPSNGRGIFIFDENGTLIPEAYEIIEIAKAGNVAIATGHLSAKESYALCKAAIDMSHKKVILTHPDNGYTLMNLDMIRSLAGMGVYIEKTFFSHVNNHSPERAFGLVKEVGAEHFFMVSDTGHPWMLRPVKALGVMVDEYLNNGFAEEEVRSMVASNPEFLMLG